MAAEKVLIQGESGSGKTFSMMKMSPDTTAIVSPEKTRLPFRNQFKMLIGKTESKDIIRFMDECVKEGKKSIIIDDFQYILAIPYMHRIKESGWDKYNDFGGNYFDIIDHCKSLPDDVIVYFMTHTETLEDGVTRTKLIGKLLREKITIEGLFTIVLKTLVVEGKFYFATQNSGKDTVKTPYGMFDSYAIENDLKYVDDKIRNYYYMDGAKTDEQMKAADEQASVPEVEKPSEGRKRRSRTEEPKTEENGSNSSETVQNQEVKTTDGSNRVRRSRNERVHNEAEEQLNQHLNALDSVDAEEVPFDEVLGKDTYFKTSDGNYIKKHSGEIKPSGSVEITEEEFNEGVKALAQIDTPPRMRRTRVRKEN